MSCWLLILGQLEKKTGFRQAFCMQLVVSIPFFVYGPEKFDLDAWIDFFFLDVSNISESGSDESDESDEAGAAPAVFDANSVLTIDFLEIADWLGAPPHTNNKVLVDKRQKE